MRADYKYDFMCVHSQDLQNGLSPMYRNLETKVHPRNPRKREELEEQYQVVFTAVCIRLILLACVLLSGAEATPDGLH